MPGDGLAHGPPAKRKAGGSHHRFGRIIRHSLRDGFNGVLRALPGDRAFLPPSPARRVSVFASLAPASGRQDHTTSPSASRHSSRDMPRPSHPASNVRDDRDTPLLWVRDNVRKPLIWGEDQPDGMRQIGTTGESLLPVKTSLREFVGWAKTRFAPCPSSLPELFCEWWARRRCAFAHP